MDWVRGWMKHWLRLIVAVADNPSMCNSCQSMTIHVLNSWAVGQTALGRSLRVGLLFALCGAEHHRD